MLESPRERVDVGAREPELTAVVRRREVLADLAGEHRDDVAADAAEAGLDHALDPESPGEQEDDGGGAPDHSEQRQECPELLRPQGEERAPRHLEEVHRGSPSSG